MAYGLRAFLIFHLTQEKQHNYTTIFYFLFLIFPPSVSANQQTQKFTKNKRSPRKLHFFLILISSILSPIKEKNLAPLHLFTAQFQSIFSSSNPPPFSLSPVHSFTPKRLRRFINSFWFLIVFFFNLIRCTSHTA